MEVVVFGYLLHLRAGIGDGDEPAAGFICSHRLLNTLKEVLLKDVWFEGASGFAGNNKQRRGEINFLFERSDLGGIGGIENVQARKSINVPERHGQNFGTET